MDKFKYISQTFDLIEKHPFLIRRSIVHDSGINPDNLIDIETSSGIKLPDSLKSFYQEFSALLFHWEIPEEYDKLNYLDPELDQVFGDIHIWPPQLLIQPWSNVSENWPDWEEWVTKDKENMLEIIRNLHILESFPMEALIGFKSINGIIEDELFYYDFENEVLINLKMNFDDYLKRGFEMKGFWKWQLYDLEKDNEYSKLIDHYLGQIFPNTKYSTP